MNKRVNKYMRMAAVFALCSAITSCSTVKPSTNSGSTSAAPQTVLSGDSDSSGLSYKYKQKEPPDKLRCAYSLTKLPEGGALINGIGKDDEKLIYRTNKDFTEFTPLSLRDYALSDVLVTAVGADGTIYVLVLSVEYEGLPEPEPDDTDIDWEMYEEAAVYSLCLDSYDSQGNLIASQKIEGDKENFSDLMYISGLAVLPDNSFAAAVYEHILFISPEGRITDSLAVEDEYISHLITDSSGNLMCITDRCIYTVDTEQKKLSAGDRFAENEWVSSAAAGTGDYSLFLNMGYSICGLKNGTLTKIADFTKCAVSPELADFILPLEGNDFAVIGWEMNNDEQVCRLGIMSEISDDELKETKVIQLALLGGDIDENLIRNFNSSNDGGYMVEAKSNWGNDGKEDMGEAFNLALVSGETPDIVCTFDYTILDNLAAKGALADLYPFIDSDTELSREAFLPNFLKVNERDGKLAILPDRFFIHTIIAKEKNIGSAKENWTVTDMLNLEESLGSGKYLFSHAASAESVLRELVFHTTSCYVDYQNKTCSFDSPEFVKLLELAKNMNYAEYDESEEGIFSKMYKEDKAVIYPVSIHNNDEYEYIKSDMFNGEKTVFLGYPSEDGKGGSFHFINNMAVMANAPEKEGAWAFLRELFSESYQKSIYEGFPVLKSQLNCSDSALEDYIEKLDKIGSFDYDIYNIIEEEAGYYFAGEHTSQQAADIIQNRVSVLVSEKG